MPVPRTILVGTDFSDCSDLALAQAVDIAAPLGATLHLVHAIAIPPIGIPEAGVAYGSMNVEAAAEIAQAAIDARADRNRDRVTLAPTCVEIGDPRDVIENVARRIEADLIVIGTHGRRGIRRMLLGSVAEEVARTAPCPVLIVRPVDRPRTTSA